ncbi:unnamed protein product [Hydatigera taeniaeformis]|uniref:Mitogen-activated protein kinase n=1 Tax=Hydatigena taeniaeformis TaxID=6205 RepID=A0A158RE33_HYDTA|nr:unnamed protein product [Hydatigera taeniaeformis]
MDHEVEKHVCRNFEILKRIGKGAYGIVWKARHKKSNTYVALKKIFDAFRNKTDAQRTFREIIFLQEFSGHPNIIKLLGVIRAQNDKDMYLVFEYMETDLHKLIKRGNILRSVHMKYITYQILKAIKYIHSADVIHRDLKPSNILLDSDCNAKVCDFGLTRSLSRNNAPNGKNNAPDLDNPELTEYVATRWYRAPEILLSSTHYTKGVDMWSIGCILAEIFIGKALFPGTSTLNQLEKIMSIGPKPSREDILCLRSDYGTSSRRRLEDVVTPVPEPNALDMVRGLLQLNPNKRLTASQALEHPYVSQFRDPESEIVMDHVVVPPLSDSKKLGISEYRSRLYNMIHETKSNRQRMTKQDSSDSGSAFRDNTENDSTMSPSQSTGSSTISLEDGSSITTTTANTTTSTETSATSPSTVSRSRIVAPPSPHHPIHLPPAKQRSENSKPSNAKFQQRSSYENADKVPLKPITMTWMPNQENRKTVEWINRTRKRQVYPDTLVKNSHQSHQMRPSRRPVGRGDAGVRCSQSSFPTTTTATTKTTTTTTTTMSTSFTKSYDIPMILRGNENRVGSDGNLTRNAHLPVGRQKTTTGEGHYEAWRRGGQRSASSGPLHLPPSNPANTVTHGRLHRALAARPWIA